MDSQSPPPSSPPPGDPFAHWFDPRRLFADGYPKRVSSALRVFPALRLEIQSLVAALDPRRALEVGPGDRPLLTGLRGAVYLDIVPRFLRRLAPGLRVQGDARRPPFKPGAFDLVVAADLFTHIPPGERPAAMKALLALAPRILIFNPEAGTPEVKMSPVPTDELVRELEAAGCAVDRRDFVAPAQKGGFYRMALLYGERPDQRRTSS